MKHVYEVINYVDPTIMDEHDSILKIIFSCMFNRFKDYRDQSEARDIEMVSREAELQLLELFQACYQDIACLKNPPHEHDFEDERRASTALSVEGLGCNEFARRGKEIFTRLLLRCVSG